MLEGLVAWVLNNYLGRYVENLNTHQLSIALLSGEVELENLPLRKDALRHLGVPIEIRAGFIGRIRLQIPITQLRSAPWIIAIERLYVVAGPAKLDDGRERLAEYERKLGALDHLEACWRRENEANQTSANYYQSSYTSWLSYGTSVITDIVENLQLRIKDVHIRYEDSDCHIGDYGLACGVHVSSLSAQTCDEQWRPQFTRREDDPSAHQQYSFKTVDLDGFSVYCDKVPITSLLSETSAMTSMIELANAMDQLGGVNSIHNYLVAPVSGYAHVTRNCSEKPLRSTMTPRLVCELALDEVPICLNDWQYEAVISASHTLTKVNEDRFRIKIKPQCSISENPKLWWIYVVRCIRPRAWSGRWTDLLTALKYAKESVEYVKAYERALLQPSGAPSVSDRKLREQIEWERDIEQLWTFREAAMRRVPHTPPQQQETPTQEPTVLAHWFPQWWWGGKGPITTPQPEIGQDITKNNQIIEGQIIEALNEAVTDTTMLKRDTVFGKFNFTLKRGVLSLQSNEKSMLELKFESFCLGIESRPRSGLHKVELGLGALSLRDLMTPDTLFPILIGAPQDPRLKPQTTTSLFHLECEIGTGIKKLKVRSQPLDVVYNAEATKWLIEFLFGPQRRAAVKLEAARTKRRLIKNWENMVEGRKEVISLQGTGNPWQLYLDISAPQIILTEKLCDKEANVAIIDLGRLHVTNQRNFILNSNLNSSSSLQNVDMASNLDKKLNDDDEDEDMFVTPCSTPPGSEASGSGSTITMQTAVTENSNSNTILPETPKSALNEGSFHERLYERYEFELSDMQVLACRAKDVWRHAHSRGTSAAHVLERFTISARCERRLIRTSDPMYPSLTLCASLPRLIAHVNEPKVNSMRAVLAALIPETNSPENPLDERENDLSEIEEEKNAEKVQNADSLLVMVQLGVEHVSLQVQSRGRSVAELQVSGASATYSRRPFDTAVTLTVHGLLLVDALQTHGPDYELLIASHRHVAMDSISGSLRDSEPTSPTSPASPDPSIPRRATSPVALTKALNGLVSPQPLIGEALICIEYTSIEGPTTEPLRIANIQFNNLDVIANQETISELIGFAKRVFPHKIKREEPLTTQFPETPLVKTELTFDFHRLNVLLMRGDDCAKKVATATMSGARIQATVDGTNEFDLHGSLGGLQVLDLTEEGRMHRRAISVGRDPLGEPPLNALYTLTESQEAGNEALAIDLKRLNKDSATEIKVRMASVWYTHSPKLLAELQLCVAEFQQYLANIARTIKAAAVDMVAIGLAQGSSVQNSPSRRRKSSLSLNQWRSTDEIDETTQSNTLNLKLDVVLDSPVVVLPRSAESTQVLVAHLGRITLDNTAVDVNTTVINEDEPQGESNGEFYKIQVKDMNLYSLETSPRRRPSSFIPRAETIYSCENLAEPLLHDTALKLHMSRKNFVAQAVSAEIDNPPDVLLEEDEFFQHNFENENDNENKNLRVNTVELLDISGSVVGALKISLSRAQYDQLLDTFRYLTNADFYRNKNSNEDTLHINNEDIGIGTLQMDPHVRARMFRGIPRRLVSQKSKVTPVVTKQFRLGFDLPLFAIELKQGHTAKVELQLRDFSFNCERNKAHETNILVSLRSLHMDDLEQPYDGPIRHMAVSSSSANDEEHNYYHHHVSRSCPDLASHLSRTRGMRHSLAFVGSLPDHLEPGRPKKKNVQKQKRTCDNNSPPQKQSQGDNLVLISCLMVDPTLLSERDFALKYNSVQRATQVDLNSLDLIVRPETWNLVLDFFSSETDTQTSQNEIDTPDSIVSDKKRVSELCVTVRSLTVTLAKKNGSRLAKATVRGVKVNKTVDDSTGVSETEGRLGRMTIADLTEHGVFYRERFQTLGEQALHVTHKFTPSNEEASNPEAILRFEMATVLYVHTKRFINEILSFFSRFGTSKAKEVDYAPENREIRRTLLEVQAGAPIILLPVSSRSSEILVADLGRLNVSNVFVTRQDRVFDVMSVELLEMDLYAAERLEMGVPEENCLSLGDGAYVKRSGKSLLNEKCRLLVTVERCLSEKPISISILKNERNEPPSLSLKGDLSTLEGTLELAHYRLIKGLLAHNLGEPIDEILLPSESTSQRQTPVSELEIRSTLTLLQLGLQNVTVHLNHDGGEPLASIYFIRSKLTIENFSDGAQDIDLLSQEIVVSDTRINAGNAFTDILGPAAHSVEEGTGTGLEVHSRRRPDYGEFTVLLNNMRVMVLPAWWVAAREYIFVPPPEGPNIPSIQPNQQKTNNETETDSQVPYELKINVTNSELVAVEDASRLDTTALTLRSTTVLNWRPGGREGEKPLTCSLNHCELFTCVLGREQETALSILDPVTVGVELSGNNGALEITIQQNLNIRLSYHDVIMLAGMLKSLKEQADSANPNNTLVTTNDNDNVRRLVGLGFSENDCIEALNHCNDDLEEAALWLTRHAMVTEKESNDSKHCRCVILTATCLVLTFIDDCGDSDVPLLELCLSDLTADQSLITTEDGGGTLQCKLSCDYYNRTLSGWEPCIEPWQCEIFWRESSGHRFLMDIRSDTLLDLNVTSALIELYKLVGESWRRDIFEVEKRPRRRFIPFALKNETGVKIGFVTSLSTRPDDENVDLSELDENQDEIEWKWVGSGETVPFEYPGGRRRQRHGDTHRARMHSLKIRVAGWKKYARVSIDRVGVYFRDVANRESGNNNVNPNKIRIVFDVRLDGQARKLVTVRSALVLTNKLPLDLDVSLGPSYECKIHSSETWSAPLEHSHQKLRIRPLNSNYGYCQPDIDWRGESKIRHEMRLCRAGTRTNPYYFSVLIRTDLWPPDNILPSHTITLLPSVLIVNLLPHDLHFSLRRLPVGTPTSPKAQVNSSEGVVTPGNESAVNSICAEDENENDTTELELKLRLEGFKCCAGVRLTSINDANYNIRLEDAQSRRLTLRVAIIRRSESAALKITISAPFWIINRTGLPLIFRQEGVSSDTAGQFQENELARMVAPLLFSWTDTDASPSVICRVGHAVSTGGQPLWCQNFHLRRGIQVRRLTVTHTNSLSNDERTGTKTLRPDTVYVVGIEVRPGRGRYRCTSIVTISPRYQLHNRTGKTLIFSQQCHASGVEVRSTHVRAVPGCQVPFHWPRPDRDLLLCVSCELNGNPNNNFSLWSGGLLIDKSRSLHVTIRDNNVSPIKFLRLEVVARGASLHAIFVEANDNLPPPLRIDNKSEVTITFAQRDCIHECVARAGTQIPYAWDEPDSKQRVLVVSAPGGATASCNMERLGPVAQLTYENFIYVAFVGTFTDSFEDESLGPITNCDDRLEYQKLVLDVPDDGGRVFIARKQPGRRSQLWRMTSTGQLQHVGSPADRTLVLDIEGPAPQPAKGDSRLALRRPDPRRRSTQTWRFTADGRLCCAHENMCVQPRDSIWGLRPGGLAVLAPKSNQPSHRNLESKNVTSLSLSKNDNIPIEQRVGKQRMRPGSGFLSVEVTNDGPTKVLCIRDDIAERNKPQTSELEDTSGEFRIVIRLTEGLGLSLVGRGPPQELIYACFINVVAEITKGKDSQQFCLSVGDIQCDNQLFGADSEIIVYTPTRIKSGDPDRQGPALSVSSEIQMPPMKSSTGVHIFRHLVVKINALVINIEEQLLLRLAEFFGVGGISKDNPQDLEATDDLEEAKPGALGVTTSTSTKYYFGVLSLSLGPVRLSVRTAKVAKLPDRLKNLRKYLGLTPLVQFEDAALAIEPYAKRHLLDTWLGTWRAVYTHFREELLWQAAVILGNVDFLGAPFGLMSDVSEGVSGLINERSVGALVMNVTHGLSNSAAKVTDALGDGLGRVLIMDEAHEETRQRIRKVTGSGHLVAGIKGFGFGLIDGATGLFRHVYEGATQDGVQGALSGVGKGLVGIVAKPVVGVLDLASEAARAVRDSSRGASRTAPGRKREPRVAALGSGGLLPRYGTGREARGQSHLHKICSGSAQPEKFVAYGPLRCSEVDDLRFIVSTERVRVVTNSSGTNSLLTVVTEVRLEDIVDCLPVDELPGPKYYVELLVKGSNEPTLLRRPRIRCDTEQVAKWASRQVNFARRLRNEKRHTLHSPDEGDDSILM